MTCNNVQFFVNVWSYNKFQVLPQTEFILRFFDNIHFLSFTNKCLLQLEKLHAMGYKPLLLLQKEGNGKKPKITSLTPRCELDPLATQHLSKITAFYELVCAGEIYSIYLFQSPYSVQLIVNPSLFFQHLSNIIVYTTNNNLITFQTLWNVGYMDETFVANKTLSTEGRTTFVAEKLSRKKINKQYSGVLRL